ncbi:TrmH family RNA methyltransferase [Roseomonas sp. BN140053]|uniref:TrmH family RNA methyltransferase n=1 Tax=Roseomonas sp. BN140053 TaxID=3391898 RepID=UPI0039E7AA9C
MCGRAAVLAAFARRPGDIQRLFYTPALRPEAGAICATLARLRRPYREVETAELARIAGTPHHGGIVAIAAQRRLPPLPVPLPAALRAAPVLPVLDGVGNPHNLGAIARSAAFFGCIGMVLSGDPRQAGLGEAAFRTAEGGLEALSLYTAADLPAALRGIGDAVLTVAAVATGGVAPEALPRDRPIALVLGNEEQGLGAATAGSCAARVTLPGSGRVESLNVSVAAAVLIHALGRRG